MGALRQHPPKFNYEKIVPSVSPAEAYKRALEWLVAERAKVKSQEPPRAIVAHHGRRKLFWGTEPDAPKVLELRFEDAGPDVHVLVTAYPLMRSQGGVVMEPELARANWGRALEGLWARFPSIGPYKAVEGALLLNWEGEMKEAARVQNQGRLVLVGGAAILAAVGYYVQTTHQTVPQWAAIFPLIASALLFAGLMQMVHARRLRRNANAQRGGPLPQPRPRAKG